MPIVPDTKDWTWVLERPCPECGFDAGALAVEAIAPAIRDNARAWRSVVTGPAESLRLRPADDRWSTLEYACHVRDVFRIFEVRLALMLEQDDPLFANWDQDRTAEEDRYGEQDPAVVVEELVDAAEILAARFETVDGADWSRPGRRSDGASFGIDSFGRYLLHDPVHHLYDVATGNLA